MSKKLNTKKKVNVKVLPGQAVYVANMERFDHIISMYDSMAKNSGDKEEKRSWLQIADEIRSHVRETYFSPEEDYADEKW
jgi:hypothetical protein